MRPTPRVSLFQNNEGFALAGVILVLTVLLAVAVPTLLTVQQEWKVADAVVESAETQGAASDLTVDLLAAWDTAFFSLGVWADTSFQKQSDSVLVDFTVTRTSDQLFLIEAFATKDGGPTHGSALTVRAGGFDFRPQAALTVAQGISIRNAAQVFGSDAVVPPTWPSSVCVGSSAENLPGVVAPDASLVNVANGATVSGSPAILGDPGVGPGTLDAPGGVDYQALVGEAHHTFASFQGLLTEGGCDVTNPNNWGNGSDPTGPCGDHFPIVHVAGDVQLDPGSRGQGILLVGGSLILTGDVHYYGVIVVRGKMSITGLGNRIRGAVYATAGELDAGGASTNPYIYNASCVLDRLRAAHPELGRGVRPVASRSWVDLSGTE